MDASQAQANEQAKNWNEMRKLSVKRCCTYIKKEKQVIDLKIFENATNNFM